MNQDSSDALAVDQPKQKTSPKFHKLDALQSSADDAPESPSPDRKHDSDDEEEKSPTVEKNTKDAELLLSKSRLNSKFANTNFR